LAGKGALEADEVVDGEDGGAGAAVAVGVGADVDAQVVLGAVAGRPAGDGGLVGGDEAEGVGAAGERGGVPGAQHAVDDVGRPAGDGHPGVQAAAGVLEDPAGEVGVADGTGDLNRPADVGATGGGGDGDHRGCVVDGHVAVHDSDVVAGVGALEAQTVGPVG